VSLRKTNLTIGIVGLLGAILLTVMYLYVAESDPEMGARMKTARLARTAFRFRSAVISRVGPKGGATLHATCTFAPDTRLPFDETGMRDVAKFVDVNYAGARDGLRDVTVEFRRESGSGCDQSVQELELAQRLPLTPSPAPGGKK